MNKKRINIFISHSWSNDKDYQDIIKLLKKNNINVGDFSVPEEKSLGNNLDNLYLEQKLKNRIRNCSIFLISCNAQLIKSEWVKNEILLANTYNKYILGIRPKGQKRTFDPKFITDAINISGGKIINYRTKTILQSIQKITGVYIASLDKPKVITKRKKEKIIVNYWFNFIKFFIVIIFILILLFKTIQLFK